MERGKLEGEETELLEFDRENYVPEVVRSHTVVYESPLLMTPERNLQEKLQAQLEFYFSDENLMRDKFLRKKIKECHSVPFDEFLKFN
jgi:hypothetical protein